jgi:hypothetical protein
VAEFWNPTSGGRPVDDADLQLVTVMPLHAVTAMYGEQGCGPGSPLTTESIARLIASIVWHFDSLALRLFNQNPGSRRRVLPGIHGDVLMINRRTCFPDHVAHVAHDQRPDIWVDVIGEDKQQVVVAFWPGEPGCPRAEQDDRCLRAQCLSALAHPWSGAADRRRLAQPIRCWPGPAGETTRQAGETPRGLQDGRRQRRRCR